MGRRTHKWDTLENTFYIGVCLLLIAAVILCLVKGSFHYAFLVFAGGGLFYLVRAVSEFIRAEAGYARRGILKIIIALVMALLSYVCRVCF